MLALRSRRRRDGRSGMAATVRSKPARNATTATRRTATAARQFARQMRTVRSRGNCRTSTTSPSLARHGECQSRNNEAASFEFCYGTTVMGKRPRRRARCGHAEEQAMSGRDSLYSKDQLRANFDPSPTACYCGEGRTWSPARRCQKGHALRSLHARAEARSFSALQQSGQLKTNEDGGAAAASSSTAISRMRSPVLSGQDTDQMRTMCGRQQRARTITCSAGFRCLLLSGRSRPDGNLPPLPNRKVVRARRRLCDSHGLWRARGRCLLRQWDRAMRCGVLPRPRPALTRNPFSDHARRGQYAVNSRRACSTVKAATVLRTVFPQRRAVAAERARGRNRGTGG